MSKGKQQAHDSFISGYLAYRYTLRFPEATNEGDYSAYFWLGFKCAKCVALLSKNDDNLDDYDDPEVIIRWQYKDKQAT